MYSEKMDRATCTHGHCLIGAVNEATCSSAMLETPRSNVKRMREYEEMARKMSAKIIGTNTGKAFTIRKWLKL